MGTVHAKSANLNKKKDLRQKEEVEVKNLNLQSVKARVDKIHVDGLTRTKDDIVKLQLTDLFKAKDFQDIIVHAYRVKGKLEALGCFKSIGIYIDTSEGPDATPDGIEITFTVRELRRLAGEIGTQVGNNEGSLIIGAKAPNLFGRGESLQMAYSHGTKKSTNINVTAVKPLLDSWLHTVLSASVFKTFNDFPWSGYNLYDTGFILDCAFNPSGIGLLKHKLQYEAAYRQTTPSSKQISFHVLEQCGPSLKSALRHICTSDKRDSVIFPTTGSLVQFSTELAGLGGDIGFVKNELIMQANWRPHENFTFQLGLQSGLLRGISNDLKINIADRFFLGGPLNLRGFDMRGCGPQMDGNAIGGDAYWATAIHMYTPLPFKPGRHSFGNMFRLHGFMNCGNVSNFSFESVEEFKKNIKIFTDGARCAAGAGIVMILGNVARVEFNFTVPLLYSRNDVLRRFQFGIGMHYL